MTGFKPLGAGPLGSSGKTPIELSLGAGAYTLTGQTIDMRVVRAVGFETGSYSFTGQSIDFRAARSAILDTGAYTFSRHPIETAYQIARERRYGRRPVVVVEIKQPRCVNRFGTAPCTATGTPKCFQTYWTCLDKENFDPSGSITWRFTRASDNVGWLYEQDDANTIRTNAIPLLLSASHSSSQLNPGASRTGESPLGRRATASVQFTDGVWNDYVGDFYLDDRPMREVRTGFFELLKARNPFYPGWTMKIYEGYEGDSLDLMQSRLFEVEKIDGPDGQGNYTFIGRDPLDVLRERNTVYPPISQIDLLGAIDSTTTTIELRCVETELSTDFGNTGSTRYLVIGDEIISYTGFTGTEPEFTLTGVTRGVLGTTASSHENEAAVQRVARHVNERLFDVARYILEDHTLVDNAYIDAAQWEDEGGTYLPTLRCNTTIVNPTAVEDLLGELCRDGMFSIWWDDRRQKIPLLAVRAPKETPKKWNDTDNLAAFSEKEEVDERMTRVSVYFIVRNILSGLKDPLNYENRRIRIDTEVESEEAAGGKIYDNVIFSRWIQTFANALLVSASLLLRFRLVPRYLSLTLDAKDRTVNVGDVIDITTRYIRDTEGGTPETRWQVIGIDEPKPGTKIRARMQSYTFIGRFGFIMENDAPTFADATPEQKEDDFSGMWISQNDGTMPDGSEGYQIQ